MTGPRAEKNGRPRRWKNVGVRAVGIGVETGGRRMRTTNRGDHGEAIGRRGEG